VVVVERHQVFGVAPVVVDRPSVVRVASLNLAFHLNHLLLAAHWLHHVQARSNLLLVLRGPPPLLGIFPEAIWQVLTQAWARVCRHYLVGVDLGDFFAL
jgi:hypothetical protein